MRDSRLGREFEIRGIITSFHGRIDSLPLVKKDLRDHMD